MTDYKAKPEVWAIVEEYGNKYEGDMLNCILELRARVEALEANAKPTPNDRQIRSSLVERVVAVIADPDGPEERWHDDARAAIREVAAWLREQHDGDLIAATMLEQEAER